MKWGACALVLAFVAGTAASDFAWADRGRGGSHFQRHDGFQQRHFQPRGDGFKQRRFKPHHDVFQQHHFKQRRAAVVRHHAPVHKFQRFPTHRSHSRARIGVFIGAPLVWHWPPPYYAYPAYPPAVAVPTSPPVYVERGDAGYGPPSDTRYWYYCQDPEGYYPYVRACPGGWQRVTPTPPDLGR